jgi:hypothetical protein
MILGISGKALVGKDTIADYIISSHGWDRKIGFASNLKSACMEIFDLSEFQVYSQEGKSSRLEEPVLVHFADIENIISWMRKTHKSISILDRPAVDVRRWVGKILSTPREVLQFVGTEVMRFYVEDYHTSVVFLEIREKENVIITDVRFPNEVNGVLNKNGVVVRIERPITLRERKGIVLDSNHLSETSLDIGYCFDYVIQNNSETLSGLYTKVDRMLESLDIHRRR